MPTIAVHGHGPLWRTGARQRGPALRGARLASGTWTVPSPPGNCSGGARAWPPSPAPASGSPRASTSGSASKRSSTSRPTSAWRRTRGPAASRTPTSSSRSGSAPWAKACPGYVTPKVAVGAAVGQRQGRAAPRQAGRLGRVALPHRMGRRRLLGRRGGGERGARGDRHRGRAAAAHRRARRAAPRLHPRAAVLPGLPLQGRWVARSGPIPSSAPTWGGSPLDKLPQPLAGAERWGQHVFAALRGEHLDVLFDRPRRPMWRGEAPTG